MRLLTALLAASLPIQSDGLAQLLPAGEFSARDGRPGPGKKWRISDAQGLKLTAQFNAVASLTPVVIDYEHQTLNAAKNGQPAPAAGWIKSATWRPGEGMFSAVEWTAAAKAAIDAGEYRYISPVISYDASGQVTGLQLAALTNFPALLGMDAVVSALNTHFNPDSQETDMTLLVSLLAALGLPAAATETQALSAVSALKATADASQASVTALTAKAEVHAALVGELGLPVTIDASTAVGALKALKGTSGDTVALVASLQGQLATLTAQMQTDQVNKTVDAAIAAHKLMPAQREQYIALGTKDMAMLTAILTTAPAIPGLGGQTADGTTAKDDGTNTAALTAQQIAIADKLGIAHDAYAAQLKATA